MKVSQRIEQRSPDWRRLDVICIQLEGSSAARTLTATQRAEFAGLYRAACADLALADAHQFPSDIVRYLHRLVGRAHSQLYRSRGLEARGWWKELFVDTPRRLFHDGALRIALGLFWGGFIASAFLATDFSPVPGYAESLLGAEHIQSTEDSFDGIKFGATGGETFMAGFYLWHNASIGLRCFVMGLVFGIGGIFETLFNALVLGALFGHMAMTPQGDNFFTFVTAHAPFELTAIVLSAAAGMRMGFSLVDTHGLSRRESLLAASREAMPTMFAGVLLFFLAALIEGFLSPSAAPYEVKALVSVLSTLLLLFYFLVLGGAAPEEDRGEDTPAGAGGGEA
ncbi:hypothetical protein Pla175_45860 [Pirellulimonas nuda]|uniref:Stage II sporulation protein M n=1 Tax=Pirellulimonas nuda TaxID=2528009 RepID=A0A518DI58_9BACT|nr:stage II sporulation protein M [Pirellulimonas nuda]QDU91166.1 hypothetical protein Pla175_45860 [Pirellulimonas nuda]